MNEVELETLARKLGNRAVDQLDPERIAQSALARLSAEPAAAPQVRRLPRWWVMGLAAAAATALILRLTLNGPSLPSPTQSAVAVPFLTELEELSPAELEVVLETLPPAAGATVHSEPAAVEQLDVNSLELLLRSLEG